MEKPYKQFYACDKLHVVFINPKTGNAVTRIVKTDSKGRYINFNGKTYIKKEEMHW